MVAVTAATEDTEVSAAGWTVARDGDNFKLSKKNYSMFDAGKVPRKK